MFLIAVKQSKKAENDISSILLKFSHWVPLLCVLFNFRIQKFPACICYYFTSE